MITTSLDVQIVERFFRDTLVGRILTSKKFEPDILEFDRMKDDAPKRHLRFAT